MKSVLILAVVQYRVVIQINAHVPKERNVAEMDGSFFSGCLP